ncbi:MAG: endopeptidase La [Kiritimatiellae bacterium]|nr:endopeptidase La [Kiritimatiellia bacterium]MDW8459506.1 endopeptidase La [Verrucomicrobiota bacterium]
MSADPSKTETPQPSPPSAEGSREAQSGTPPELLPVLPLSDLVVFPGMIAPVVVNTQRSIKLIEDVGASNRFLIAVLQKNRDLPDDQVSFRDLMAHGCVCRLLKMLRFPDDTVRVLLQGVARCKLIPDGEVGQYLRARYQTLDDEGPSDSIEVVALARNASTLFQEIITMSPTLPDELKIAVVNIEDPGRLSDLIAANLNLTLEDRQKLLEENRPVERLKILAPLLNREREVLRVGNEIQSRVSQVFSKSQREYFLREQLKAIKKELGESDPQQLEMNELEEKIAKAKMPPEVEKIARKEMARLASIPTASPEQGIIRSYLDILCELPWSVVTEDHLDIGRAAKILDEDHYDLKKVKDRILEYLSVLKLKRDMRGPILCFVGPPGVGKTSLGQSIARALGRAFVRISLGGIRDEAEIRGHRRTYIGAMPGRIIQSLRKAGTRNPVFMLDEIDKLGADFRGDPAAALLEVLDPAQNNSFTDHYLDAPFDLSQVLFIATGNIIDTMPPPLRDRMEMIEIPGYTLHEKIFIATKHLIPRQIENHGLKPDQISIPEETVRRLIVDYTREAGVRNLDRELAGLCRKAARRVAEGRARSVVVRPELLRNWIGPIRFESENAEKRTVPGVVTGLAWTSTGGDILFIEATKMAGKGNLILTGSLGDVMKESARAALSYVRAHADEWGLDPKFAEHMDFHIHVPAGAIPKDGPSAGLAMLAALVSLLTGRPVSSHIAMTGEITLRGRIMPVGGIKEKVLAAARAGIREIIMPASNRRHLDDVPAEIRKTMHFHFVQQANRALRFLFPANQQRKVTRP